MGVVGSVVGDTRNSKWVMWFPLEIASELKSGMKRWIDMKDESMENMKVRMN